MFNLNRFITASIALALGLGTSTALAQCPGDNNGDNVINGTDLTILLACWGSSCGDANNDGTANGADLTILLAGWGSCGPTISSVSPAFGAIEGGTPITITGANFNGTTSVKVGLLNATNVVVVSPSQVTAAAPAGFQGLMNTVKVITPYGTAEQSNGFTHNAALAGSSSSTFTPTFDLETPTCGTPTTGAGSVSFGGTTDGQAYGGRACSTKGYKNITRVTYTVDLSGMNATSASALNYINATIYMVNNPTTPTLQPMCLQYGDAGGNCPSTYNGNQYDPCGTQNAAYWNPPNVNCNCREIDFLETNGNKIFQATMHLGTGGSSAPQRYEYSFTSAANTSCYNYSSMLTQPTSTNGLHSLVGLNVSLPFQMQVDFVNTGSPSMKVTVSQSSFSATIYDTSAGTGAQGSGSLTMSDLTTTMAQGYWIIASLWQGYSPAGPNWWNNSCSWNNQCQNGYGWKLTNLSVVAEATVGN